MRYIRQHQIAEIVFRAKQGILQDGDIRRTTVGIPCQVNTVHVNIAGGEHDQRATDRIDTSIVFDNCIIHRHAQRRTIEDIDARTGIRHNTVVIHQILNLKLDLLIIDFDKYRASRGKQIRHVEDHGIQFSNGQPGTRRILSQTQVFQGIEYFITLCIISCHRF